jgi:hypothetical protein
MAVLLSGLQNRVKNSAAYAEELGLMLIANGEEMPYLLTSQGEQIPAGIPPSVAQPVVVNDGAGNIPDTKWVVYAIVYASENSFPLIAPRILSNPSPLSDAFEVTGGNSQLQITFDGSDNPIVTDVYIYRTAPQDTETLADTAAAAGALNFVGQVANVAGSIDYIDNLASAIGNEPIDYTSFVVPQFRFVVWDGSYFWGFANHPFSAEATWDVDGTLTLNTPAVDKFYGGRDDQFITFDSIHVGGIDNRGTFLFQQTGDFTGKVIDENGDDMTLPSTTSGNIVIVGPTANLYRSAFRNPFAWGYQQNIAGTYIPNRWELKISGALGTAIAIVPDQQLLKLDMEFPALCLTFALQTAGTDVFASTKRQVSRLHSVTSHFSQFNAISKGRQVLWGMDFKNLAIVECDGYTQVPVSGPISTLLRRLSINRSLHMLCHGIYDPATEINAIWLSSNDVDEDGASTQFDLCVYQHAPTGFWGVFTDFGILSSAAVEDPVTSRRNTLVGTETGFVGKAFDVATYGNWLPTDSIWTGLIREAYPTIIYRSEGQDDFNPLDAGLIGNYVLVVDDKGLQPQVRKITGATFDSLTLDEALDPVPPTTEETGLTDTTQWKFFIGLIELRVLKYFNNGEPSIDKVPREYWATLVDAENPQVEFYAEHAEIPTVSVLLKRDNTLDAWFNKMEFPTLKGKSYGLALVDRSYGPTKFYDFTHR